VWLSDLIVWPWQPGAERDVECC